MNKYKEALEKPSKNPLDIIRGTLCEILIISGEIRALVLQDIKDKL